MKKLLTILSVLFTLNSFAQTTAIPDPNFEQELINLGLDVLLDGQVLTANIDTVTALGLSMSNILDLNGIQGFIALTSLNCEANSLTSLDVTQNTLLTYLNCGGNQINNIDVTQNTALIYLNCYGNTIGSIDITQNTLLTDLLVFLCSLTSIDISNNILLSSLDCRINQLISLDVTQNSNLTYLNCRMNQITSLNVSQNLNLIELNCFSNQISELDISNNTSLNELYCHDNQLTCLNSKNGNNTNFSYFYAHTNPNLTCIEVDNVAWSTANWTNIDTQTSFNSNCNNTCSTVGINEFITSDFSLYPNPTSTSLAIESELTIDKIEILDVSGRLVKSINQVSYSIDVSELPNGIYFLKLIGDDVAITKKFVKN